MESMIQKNTFQRILMLWMIKICRIPQVVKIDCTIPLSKLFIRYKRKVAADDENEDSGRPQSRSAWHENENDKPGTSGTVYPQKPGNIVDPKCFR